MVQLMHKHAMHGKQAGYASSKKGDCFLFSPVFIPSRLFPFIFLWVVYLILSIMSLLLSTLNYE